ncbi:DUF4405 domain-containing protein [Methanolobus sediminis]|uniref:DUF4405 domain-containing protein n=1 Tax=Methanolobus sediminis TaxID=3072978 RepID=A0AA51UJ91_9EURY|nr:DUF4405 domain-containing protein [Methanolobus sediminis]WMW24562.1 DUF4405 domain-containing protein [Methanolobus sediminis]
MNISKLNYYVDILLAVLFIVVAITGFVLYLVIPSGVRQGRYQEFIGITKVTWTLIHNRSAILLTLLTGLHFVLHKRWMCCMTRNLFKREGDRKNTECEMINV